MHLDDVTQSAGVKQREQKALCRAHGLPFDLSLSRVGDGVSFTPRPLFDLFGFTEQSANYRNCQLGNEKTGAASPDSEASQLRGEAGQRGRKWKV